MADKQVALITGANKGLGLEIARQLGQQGYTVVIGARDAERGRVAADSLKAAGIDAYNVQLDVTNEAQVAALPSYFQSNFGRLDVLVNNAGVMFDREGVTAQTLRDTFEANVVAVYNVTETLLPLLKASPAGRIVNHSSILGSLTANATGQTGGWLLPAYNSSKAALNMLTVQWATALKDTNVKVNSAHPGWVKTDMGTDEAPMEVVDGAKTAVGLATLPADGPSGGFFHMGESLPW